MNQLGTAGQVDPGVEEGLCAVLGPPAENETLTAAAMVYRTPSTNQHFTIRANRDVRLVDKAGHVALDELAGELDLGVWGNTVTRAQGRIGPGWQRFFEAPKVTTNLSTPWAGDAKKNFDRKNTASLGGKRSSININFSGKRALGMFLGFAAE